MSVDPIPEDIAVEMMDELEHIRAGLSDLSRIVDPTSLPYVKDCAERLDETANKLGPSLWERWERIKKTNRIRR